MFFFLQLACTWGETWRSVWLGANTSALHSRWLGFFYTSFFYLIVKIAQFWLVENECCYGLVLTDCITCSKIFHKVSEVVWSDTFMQLTVEKAFFLSNRSRFFSILPELKIKIALFIICVHVPYLTTADAAVLPVFSITMVAIPAPSDTLNSATWNWNTPGGSLKTKQIAKT